MRLMRLSEAARQFDLSVSTIRRLIRSGQLPSVRPSARSVRIAEDDLRTYLCERRTCGAVN